MGHEIEAKLKYEKHEDLRKVLRHLKAEFKGEHVQRDVYFDDARGTLRASGAALRLREEKDVKSGAAGKVIITWKGAHKKSHLKKRPEANLEVADALAAEELLAGLGYGSLITIEKRRSVWLLGGCEVALDELPLAGRYVEIEGKDEKTIARVQSQLGLDGLEHVTHSYTSIVSAEMKKRGKRITDITFDEPA
jgi:adenylate cyclase, class 2